MNRENRDRLIIILLLISMGLLVLAKILYFIQQEKRYYYFIDDKIIGISDNCYVNDYDLRVCEIENNIVKVDQFYTTSE